MKHFEEAVEIRINRVSDWHSEIIEYLESVYEYDDLDEEEYIEAYQETERLFENGEVD